MSSEEFAEWIAFDRGSPGEPERGDLRAALIATVIANSNKSKKGRSYTMDDFLLKFKSKVLTQTSAENIRIKLESWRAGYNAILKQAKETKMKKKSKKEK